MPTISEIKAQLETNTLTINSLVQRRADIARDIDFPHLAQNELRSIEGRISTAQNELTAWQSSRDLIIARLNAGAMQIKVDVLLEQIAEARARRVDLTEMLQSAQETETVEKDTDLIRLKKLMAKLSPDELKVFLSEVNSVASFCPGAGG